MGENPSASLKIQLHFVFLEVTFPAWCFQMSKESTLSDAIDHIKKLQNEVLELQTQLADSPGEAPEKQGSASCSESFAPTDSIHYQVLSVVMALTEH
jgi:hypothetical protein